MAALADTPFRAADLRTVGVEQIAPVLEAQISEWRSGLNWDFHPSAILVRRFVKMRALAGCALVGPGGIVAGYAYFVAEEGKGLIGDVYVLPRFRSNASEGLLLEGSLETLFETANVARVESQILLLSDAVPRNLPYAACARAFPRLFLEAGLHGYLPPRALAPHVTIAPWSLQLQEATGRLMALSYEGHIDAEINDQYRSAVGARRFLTNIVQYPGCGTFYAPASFASFAGDALCGASLASLVAPDVGHITQVCVSPSHKGTGLGYELVRRSMDALLRHGCRSVSLTVTAANEAAVRLYRKMGFATRRSFNAYVWQR